MTAASRRHVFHGTSPRSFAYSVIAPRKVAKVAYSSNVIMFAATEDQRLSGMILAVEGSSPERAVPP
eukprot:7524873-Alexandrium_andersonii.AAC.1